MHKIKPWPAKLILERVRNTCLFQAARKAKNRLSSATRLGVPSDVEDRGAKPTSGRRRPTVTRRPHKETAAANGVDEADENEKEEEKKPQLEVKLAAEPKPIELKLNVRQKQPEIKSSTTDFGGY